MRHYRFRLADQGGTRSTAELHLADDLDALDVASEFAKDFAVEIFEADALIATIKRECAPSTILDPTAG